MKTQQTPEYNQAEQYVYSRFSFMIVLSLYLYKIRAVNS